MRVSILLSALALASPASAAELTADAHGGLTVPPRDDRQGMVGLRVGVTRTVDDQGTSFQFAGRGEDLQAHGVLSTHGAHFFRIGGGSAGFDGGLGLLFGVGARIPVAAEHGPFARLGARGFLQGGVTLGIVPKPPEGRPRPRT